MTLEEYDIFVKTLTWVPIEERRDYAFETLISELGEVIGKRAKLRRGDYSTPEQFSAAVMPELGDLLFVITMLGHTFDVSLQDILDGNVKKLEGRIERGTILGSGDHR